MTPPVESDQPLSPGALSPKSTPLPGQNSRPAEEPAPVAAASTTFSPAADGSVPPRPSQATQVREALQQRFKELLTKERYSEARSFGEQLLGLYQQQDVGPQEHVALLRQLGGLYCEAEQYPRAITCYQQALIQQERVEPVREVELVRLRYELGLVYRAAGQYQQGLPLFDQFCRHWQQRLADPAPWVAASWLATGYYELGETYQQLGNFTQALAYADKALQVPHEPWLVEEDATRPNLYLLRGEACQELGDYAGAIAAKRQARQLWEAPVWPMYPSSSSCVVVSAQQPNLDCLSKVYLSLAVSYDSLGDYRRALAYERRVVTLWAKWAPHHASAREWRSAAYRAMSATHWQRKAYVYFVWYQLCAYSSLPSVSPQP